MRTTLGCPCPVCGLSTVAVRALKLDVAGAARLDPVGLVLIGVIGVIASLQVLRSLGRRVPAIPWRWSWIVPLVLVLTHWALTLSGVVTLSPLR